MYLIRKFVIVHRVYFTQSRKGGRKDAKGCFSLRLCASFAALRETNSLNLMTLPFRDTMRICELNT